jgi:hypothetical protein
MDGAAPFLLPSGRRWPEGSDEGASFGERINLSLALKVLVAPLLTPLIYPSGIFSPRGEEVDRHSDHPHTPALTPANPVIRISCTFSKPKG